MSDLGMSVKLTRTSLGLPDLEINDHSNYYVAEQFLGGQTQWNRTQVTSPWVDGAVTTQRYRQMVTEQIAVEVLGTSKTDIQNNLIALIHAFMQDSYYMTTILDGSATYSYLCESADYQITWTGPRAMANQLQVVLGVPRQPVAQAGI